MRAPIVVLLAAVLACGRGLPVAEEYRDSPLASSGVALVASPVTSLDARNISHRHPQVYWWGLGPSGYIGLWTHDPTKSLADPIETISHHSLHHQGYHAFSSLFDSSLLPNNVTDIPEGSCLPLWVGYILEGHAIHVDCLKIHPKWMESLRSEGLGKLQLSQVTMPGSHDAGSSYAYLEHSQKDIEVEWAYTHHNSLYHQLVAGTRYLDMRIAFYPYRPHKYYINHNFVEVCPLKIGLRDVARFMSETKEIVVFDIHQLLRFGGHPHAVGGLKTLLQSYFSKWMAPTSYLNKTLGDFWESDKRLIVTMSDHQDELYWPLVRHFYPDTDNITALFDYFDRVLPKQAGSETMWSMNAEFTPNVIDILKNRWGGLTGAANMTNFPVSREFASSWSKQRPNIVAMDYVWGSDVIDVAIDTTKHFLHKRQYKYIA